MGLFKTLGKLTGLGGGPKSNPADSAMPYLNQIRGVGEQYHNPFIQQGQQSAGINNPIYSQMAQDPGAYLNKLMEGYSPSKGYQFKQDQLQRGLQNSAAQGGFAGTENAQMEQGDLINNLLGGDMQQYLANLLGIQGAGLQGHEGNVSRGFQSSGNLADYIGNALGSQSSLAYQGNQQQNQYSADRQGRKAQFFGDLLKSISGGMGSGGFGGGGNPSAGQLFGGSQNPGMGGGMANPSQAIKGGGAWSRLGNQSNFGGGGYF